ncbi:MAG: hypothetical protein V1731_00040 [Candidatus Aenigmatarchaeota archaeon]
MNKFAYEQSVGYVKRGNAMLRGSASESKFTLACEMYRQASNYHGMLKPKKGDKIQQAEYKKASTSLDKLRSKLQTYARGVMDSKVAEVAEAAANIAETAKTETSLTSDGSYDMKTHKDIHRLLGGIVNDVKETIGYVNSVKSKLSSGTDSDKEFGEYATRRSEELKTLGKNLEEARKALERTDHLVDDYWKKTLENRQN